MTTQQEKQSTGTPENKKTDNANSSDDPKQLHQQIPITDTPFHAVKAPTNEENGNPAWFLTMGKYRLSEPMQTLEEVLEDCKNTGWNRLLAIMKIMIIEHDAEKQNQIKKKDNLAHIKKKSEHRRQ